MALNDAVTIIHVLDLRTFTTPNSNTSRWVAKCKHMLQGVKCPFNSHAVSQ